MSYNILNKNVNFQGEVSGTVEDLVDTHANQTISGSKDFNILTGSNIFVRDRISVNTTSQQYHVTVIGSVSASTHGFFGGTVSGSEFYGGGSNLTGLAVTAMNSGSEDRLVTIGSTTSELDGEPFLTFDSSNRRLTVGGTEDETQWGTIVVNGGQISGSGNISGSAFYGDGSNLSNIQTPLSSAGGLSYDGSNLRIDMSGMTDAGSTINDADEVIITQGGQLKKIDAEKIAGLFDAAVTVMNNKAEDRLVTIASSTSQLDGEANLTFDGSKLTIAGNITGSGYVSASAFIARGEGAKLDIGAGLVTAGGALFDSVLGFAGAGTTNNSGKIDVQVSGAVNLVPSGLSSKIGITGSIAGNGLEYAGGSGSISGLAVKLDSNSGLAVGASGLKTNFAGLASATPVVASDNLTFIDSDGDKKCSFSTFLTAIAGANLGVSGSQLTASAGGGSVDIDGLSALGGTGLHQTQDHFMFSDNGTEKKITFSNLEDAIFANVSGDVAIAAGGGATIQANAVEGSMINSNAAGDGLGYASNALKVQVSGAIHVASDKVAITGSIAGNGLEYAGGVDSISALEVKVSDFMSNGSNNRIVTAADANSMNAEANLTFDGSLLTGTNITSSFTHYAAGVISGIGDTQTSYYNASGSNADLYLQFNEQGNTSPLFAIAGTNHASVPGQIKTLCTLSSSADVNVVNVSGSGDLLISQTGSMSYLVVSGSSLTSRAILQAPNSVPGNNLLHSGSISFFLDEGNHKLKVRVKYADGTMKDGEISLS